MAKNSYGTKRQHTAPSNPVLLYTNNKYSSVTVLVSKIQSLLDRHSVSLPVVFRQTRIT